MDSNTDGILGICGILISLFGIVYSTINHKKIRAKCCNRNLEFSIDIDPTSQRTMSTAPTVATVPTVEAPQPRMARRPSYAHTDEST